MRTLREGMTGADVSAWQVFLRGWSPRVNGLVVDGVYGRATVVATRIYQRTRGLSQDGAVGPRTLGAAMLQDGYHPLDDSSSNMTSKSWPAPPQFGPLSIVERAKIFGAPLYAHSPEQGNPEHVELEHDWVQHNIVLIAVPELTSSLIVGAPRGGQVQCHRLVAPKVLELFSTWTSMGLIGRINSWAGMWAPRFVRGSRVTLSNHALGTAFDINAAWNALGTAGALVGEHGCVRELVESANSLGWWWGGHWGQPGLGAHSNRPDPMHFELARL